MGKSKDSPTPLDAIDCGTPVVLPARQHQFVDKWSKTKASLVAARSKKECIEGIIRNLGETNVWRPTNHTETLKRRLKTVFNQVQETCHEWHINGTISTNTA